MHFLTVGFSFVIFVSVYFLSPALAETTNEQSFLIHNNKKSKMPRNKDFGTSLSATSSGDEIS